MHLGSQNGCQFLMLLSFFSALHEFRTQCLPNYIRNCVFSLNHEPEHAKDTVHNLALQELQYDRELIQQVWSRTVQNISY